MKKTTCLDIELAILRTFNIRQSLIVPTVTDQMMLVPFEVDMLVLRNSGCAIGFEIKVSKADLKNDLKKKHIINPTWDRYYRKFKHFYYAVPSELEQEALNQIPKFIGLYVYTKNDYPIRNTFKEVRKPTKVSDYKWSDKERYELARLGTMRIKTLKENINALKNRFSENK